MSHYERLLAQQVGAIVWYSEGCWFETHSGEGVVINFMKVVYTMAQCVLGRRVKVHPGLGFGLFGLKVRNTVLCQILQSLVRQQRGFDLDPTAYWDYFFCQNVGREDIGQKI